MKKKLLFLSEKNLAKAVQVISKWWRVKLDYEVYTSHMTHLPMWWKYFVTLFLWVDGKASQFYDLPLYNPSF